MNKGLAPPRTDAAGYGQKNKPTTFRKSWLGLNISSRPLFMRSAPHYYCSDGKGRDKNLNVQGIWRKVSEKSAVKERKGMKRKKSRNDQGIRSPEAEAPGQIFEKYTNI